MKKITTTIFIITLLITSCKPDNRTTAENKRLLSEKEMLEDFDLFEDIYKSANAGLYKYRSDYAIDSIFRKSRNLN